MKKSDLVYLIREAVKNTLTAEAIDYNGQEEPKEIKKARLAGSLRARQKFTGKSPEELQRAYLEIEQKASFEMDDLKNTFLWGALDAIKKMLRAQGLPLPRRSADPWTR